MFVACSQFFQPRAQTEREIESELSNDGVVDLFRSLLTI